jgi:hypothetical protein
MRCVHPDRPGERKMQKAFGIRAALCYNHSVYVLWRMCFGAKMRPGGADERAGFINLKFL